MALFLSRLYSRIWIWVLSLFTSVYIRQKRTSNMAKRKAAEEGQTNKDDEELQLKEWKPERILLNSVLRLYFVLDEKQLACFDIYLSENTQHIINAKKCALDFDNL